MSRRKEKKCRLQVEELEARDTPSAPAFPFDAGIVRADAVTPQQRAVSPALIAILIGPRQAAVHSPVGFNPVVITPETGPTTVAGGNVDRDVVPDVIVGADAPQGHVKARLSSNHNEGGFVPPGQVLGRKAGMDQQEYGIVRAGAVMPPQAQAVEHSPVFFNPVVITPETGPTTVAGGDVNGDGFPDVLVGAQASNGHAKGRPFANDNQGGFVPPGQVLGRKAGGEQHDYGIVRAGAVMPPQAQAVEHSPVFFNPVVITPETGPPTAASPDGGFVPEEEVLAKKKVTSTGPIYILAILIG